MKIEIGLIMLDLSSWGFLHCHQRHCMELYEVRYHFSNQKLWNLSRCYEDLFDFSHVEKGGGEDCFYVLMSRLLERAVNTTGHVTAAVKPCGSKHIRSVGSKVLTFAKKACLLVLKVYIRGRALYSVISLSYNKFVFFILSVPPSPF